MTMEKMMYVTELITTLVIGRGLTSKKLAPIFQQAGGATERLKRIGRAEGMAKVREELRKLSSRRMKEIHREHEPEDMEIRLKSRRECSRRMEKGELRSHDVGNKHVQDYGSKMVIVGSDVEALYPSLEALEVA